MESLILSGLTVILLLVSVLNDRKKTLQALRIALKRFGKISVPLALMIVLISIILYVLPQERITQYLDGGTKIWAMISASVIGSLSLMPGFIAFPLGGVLRQNNIPYMIIAAFTSTLMMVGIITIPVERQYLGIKVTLIRNAIALVTALCVAWVTGLLYGEF